ncbi:MAG: hypothetical protein J5986_07660 [Roseburia sp.]|nr:hypothetical protein [Roseburia sp.]
MKKVEKIVKLVFIIAVAVYGIFGFLFAFANDFWCRYMQFFEMGIKCSFLVLWVCAGVLVTIKIIKKHIKN